MPEGDTLFRTAAGLRPLLVGRVVIAARWCPSCQAPGAASTTAPAAGLDLTEDDRP